jgi:hypothetical protein
MKRTPFDSSSMNETKALPLMLALFAGSLASAVAVVTLLVKWVTNI